MTARADTYTNPVIRGFHPDPSICRVGDDFYLVVSSFEYFPAIPLFHSTDLVSWQQIGHVLDRPGQVDLTRSPDSGGVFAPTIRHHDGRFYVTATNISDGGHFIVHATDPRGPWSDPVRVDQNGIDPSLFFEDGRAYFSSNVEPDPAGPHLEFPDFERGIQQSVVDPLTGDILEPPRFIWGGAGGRYPEGPHLFRRDSFYYLLISEGGTEYGHMATVGRSRSPWGPFEASPYGPMLRHAGMPSPFQAVGHADMVDIGTGEWWLVCLGIRPTGQWPRHHLGRETMLAPVDWTVDGWPRVGDSTVIPAVAARPPLEPAPVPLEGDAVSFGVDGLAPGWQTVRRALTPEELAVDEGRLRLASTRPLHRESLPCFVGRRQADHRFRARTSLDLAKVHGEAGIAVRMNDTHCYSLGVRRDGDRSHLAITRSFGDETIEYRAGDVDSHDEVVLSVTGTPEHYEFSVGTSAGSRTFGRLDARMLSTEFAGGFTGVFVGLYVAGDPDATARAEFGWFEYESQIGTETETETETASEADADLGSEAVGEPLAHSAA